MSEIKESRVISIKDKIVSLKDVRAIAALIASEVAAADKDDKNWLEVKYAAETFDGSEFQSADPSIFSDDSSVNRRRVKQIEMSYMEKNGNKRISVSISHDGYWGRNSIKVSGTDSKWVNGTISQFEQIITAIPPQNTFFKRWNGFLLVIASLGIGAIILWLLSKVLLSAQIHPPQEPEGIASQVFRYIASFPIGNYALKYFFYYLAGWGPGYELIRKLLSLWPSVEIQIGPEHEQVEKQRRIWVINVFVLGVLPLCVAILYDIVKAIGASS
ncbi:MAG TPA: hypothetical protein VIF37_12920 [Methylobacter sp.]|jgi:hypothetical protein